MENKRIVMGSNLSHDIMYRTPSQDDESSKGYLIYNHNNPSDGQYVVLPMESVDGKTQVTDMDLTIILYHKLLSNGKTSVATKVVEIIGMLGAEQMQEDINKNIIDAVIDSIDSEVFNSNTAKNIKEEQKEKE